MSVYCLLFFSQIETYTVYWVESPEDFGFLINRTLWFPSPQALACSQPDSTITIIACSATMMDEASFRGAWRYTFVLYALFLIVGCCSSGRRKVSLLYHVSWHRDQPWTETGKVALLTYITHPLVRLLLNVLRLGCAARMLRISTV